MTVKRTDLSKLPRRADGLVDFQAWYERCAASAYLDDPEYDAQRIKEIDALLAWGSLKIGPRNALEPFALEPFEGTPAWVEAAGLHLRLREEGPLADADRRLSQQGPEMTPGEPANELALNVLLQALESAEEHLPSVREHGERLTAVGRELWQPFCRSPVDHVLAMVGLRLPGLPSGFERARVQALLDARQQGPGGLSRGGVKKVSKWIRLQELLAGVRPDAPSREALAQHTSRHRAANTLAARASAHLVMNAMQVFETLAGEGVWNGVHFFTAAARRFHGRRAAT